MTEKPIEGEVVNKEDDLGKFESRSDTPQPGALTVQETSPNALIAKALALGQDLNQLEKLLEIQIKYEKNEAEKAFHDARANFAAEAPVVTKDKKNKGFNNAPYTSLGNLLSTYGPALGKFGLSVSFPTPDQTDTHITGHCKLSHKMGHSETMSIKMPIDAAATSNTTGKRARNAIQDIKSTFTYLRSVTCEGVLGVAGTEGTFDDDGNAAGTTYITLDQQTEISDAIKETGYDEKLFLDWICATSIKTITETQYKTAIQGLKDIKDDQDKKART